MNDDDPMAAFVKYAATRDADTRAKLAMLLEHAANRFEQIVADRKRLRTN